MERRGREVDPKGKAEVRILLIKTVLNVGQEKKFKIVTEISVGAVYKYSGRSKRREKRYYYVTRNYTVRAALYKGIPLIMPDVSVLGDISTLAPSQYVRRGIWLSIQTLALAGRHGTG